MVVVESAHADEANSYSAGFPIASCSCTSAPLVPVDVATIGRVDASGKRNNVIGFRQANTGLLLRSCSAALGNPMLIDRQCDGGDSSCFRFRDVLQFSLRDIEPASCFRDSSKRVELNSRVLSVHTDQPREKRANGSAGFYHNYSQSLLPPRWVIFSKRFVEQMTMYSIDAPVNHSDCTVLYY